MKPRIVKEEAMETEAERIAEAFHSDHESRKLMIAVVEHLIATRAVYPPSVLSALAEEFEKRAKVNRANHNPIRGHTYATAASEVRSLIEDS